VALETVPLACVDMFEFEMQMSLTEPHGCCERFVLVPFDQFLSSSRGCARGTGPVDHAMPCVGGSAARRRPTLKISAADVDDFSASGRFGPILLTYALCGGGAACYCQHEYFGRHFTGMSSAIDGLASVRYHKHVTSTHILDSHHERITNIGTHWQST
jgi:hypothetical protein